MRCSARSHFCGIVREWVPASLAHAQHLAGASVYVPAEPCRFVDDYRAAG